MAPVSRLSTRSFSWWSTPGGLRGVGTRHTWKRCMMFMAAFQQSQTNRIWQLKQKRLRLKAKYSTSLRTWSKRAEVNVRKSKQVVLEYLGLRENAFKSRCAAWCEGLVVIVQYMFRPWNPALSHVATGAVSTIHTTTVFSYDFDAVTMGVNTFCWRGASLVFHVSLAFIIWPLRAGRLSLPFISLDDFLSIANKEENECFKDQMRYVWTILDLGAVRRLRRTDQSHCHFISHCTHWQNSCPIQSEERITCTNPNASNFDVWTIKNLHTSRNDELEQITKLPYKSLVSGLRRTF